ncbi:MULTISPECIES: hypothetical protein [unclassified Shewanella]|uniref:hypothetical protein n=1 Tax=unclassified Shewanella TaxID=196818 RepID=UPI000CAF30C2|nr:MULTISPECIES: hypothetical protein [unclassified Shewanella]PIX72233.1 MAG: hypothetical protein COZ42_06690 [Shewanella sp. CG_4_10_14_3_um_filter_42_91]PIY65003.1 MAG: hypothetical protein COY92_14275 [Shewanella sp. CG_4_10_14_0_8_um_filter_42_13]|tara:strand:- start:996 stop:1448 length:453 start_codon:yes stop_codon:yes gene_type:complete
MYTSHFTAIVTDFLRSTQLDLLSREDKYFVTQHNGTSSKILLNGSKSLLAAISMVQTVTSDPFITVEIIKQLNIPLPSVANKLSFTRPELTRCIVVGVYKDRFSLVVATDEPCELSKATLLDGDFSTTLSDIKLFDMVQADPRSHTIKFS